MLAAGLAAALLLASPPAPRVACAEPATVAKDPADVLMKKMLDALKADAYDLWLETAPKMRATSKATFESLHARYGPMLLKGYKTTYLGARRDKGLEVHSWKLELAASQETFEVRLTTREDRVETFAIQ
jgi:hypothetical protein